MKDGNEPERPHQTGLPARGFCGGANVHVRLFATAFAASFTSGTAAFAATSRMAILSIGCASLHALAQAPGAAALPPSSTTAAVEFKLSVAVGPAYAWGKGATDWAQMVRDRTGGRVLMKVLPGASATGGDPLQEFVGLKQGSVDFAVGSTMYWAGYVKALNLFALPFLIPDAKTLDALTTGPVGLGLFKALEDAGVVPLAWGDNELHAVSTSQKPIRKPDDLKGLKVRVTGSTAVEEAFRAMGATPARYRSLDAQNALIGGAVDGQETVPQSFVATKAHTLNQRHLTLWAIAAEPLIFAASRSAWERLAPGDRDIVRKAAVDAAKKEVDASRAATTAAIASLAAEFRAANVQVIRPSADERAVFSAATKSVYDRWAAEIGVDLVRQAEEIVGRGPARAATAAPSGVAAPAATPAAAPGPTPGPTPGTPPAAPPTAPAAAETSAVPTLTQ